MQNNTNKKNHQNYVENEMLALVTVTVRDETAVMEISEIITINKPQRKQECGQEVGNFKKMSKQISRKTFPNINILTRFKEIFTSNSSKA